MQLFEYFTGKRSLIRIIVVRTFATILIIIGLIIFPLPIPLGLLFMFIGLAILVAESKTTRAFLTQRRRTNPKVDNWIRKAYPKLPKFLKKFFDLTDPNMNL